MAYNFAVIDPDGNIQSNIVMTTKLGTGPRIRLHENAQKMLANPSTVPGVLISGLIAKRSRKSGLWFVSLDRTRCIKLVGVKILEAQTLSCGVPWIDKAGSSLLARRIGLHHVVPFEEDNYKSLEPMLVNYAISRWLPLL